MKLSSILAGFALVSIVAGCGSAPGTESSDSTGSAIQADKKSLPTGIDNPAYLSCDLDSECVAVAPPPGCCDHGLKDAVNKAEVASWNTANACTTSQVCAHFVTVETRKAECDSATNLCAMVAPQDIACDGNVVNPHRCPTGWHCNHQGHSRSLPGVCQQVDAGATTNP